MVCLLPNGEGCVDALGGLLVMVATSFVVGQKTLRLFLAGGFFNDLERSGTIYKKAKSRVTSICN